MHNFFVGDLFERFNGFFHPSFFEAFLVSLFLHFFNQNMGTGNRELRSLVVSVEFEVVGEVQVIVLFFVIPSFVSPPDLVSLFYGYGIIILGTALCFIKKPKVGLYYMKYCKEECLKLGLCGWVKSTRRGAIVGKIQGPRPKVEQMISWLSSRGSPGSRIDTCYLYNYEYLPRPDFRGFNIRF